MIDGGTFIWAGGVKAPELMRGSGLPVEHNGRIKVDDYLRVIDHSNIFVAGDLASVVNAETGPALPALAQVAVQEGEAVAKNLRATLEGRSLIPFTLRDKGFVVSIGGQSGVAQVAGVTIGGRLAHAAPPMNASFAPLRAMRAWLLRLRSQSWLRPSSSRFQWRWCPRSCWIITYRTVNMRRRRDRRLALRRKTAGARGLGRTDACCLSHTRAKRSGTSCSSDCRDSRSERAIGLETTLPGVYVFGAAPLHEPPKAQP